MSELEVKFQVPAGGAAALRKAAGHGLKRVRLQARYFDTADGLLARHAMALRLRDEDGQWVQTLKAALPHALERLEDNVPLGPVAEREGITLVPEPALHAGGEVGAQLARLLRAHGQPPLVETYRTDVTRQHRLLHAHDATVEWALDEGAILAGEAVRPVLELELEFKAGETAGLFALALDWQARHGLHLDPVSKAQRGTLLCAGERFAPPVKAQVPHLAPGMDGAALARAIVSACLAQILSNAGEFAAGSDHPEHVHQLRVGLRRLRTALRAFADEARALGPECEPEVVGVFDALGEARDRRVLAESLVPELEAAGAPLADPALAVGADLPSEVALLARARDRVRGSQFQMTLLRLLAFAQVRAVPLPTPAPWPAPEAGAPARAFDESSGSAEPGGSAEPAPPSQEPALDQVRAQLDHLQHQVARAAPGFEALSFEEQHTVRKRLKRLRYLAEFVAPRFKPRRVEVWLHALEPAQDVLGSHIDRWMAARRYERLALTDPRAWFAAGWLRARLQDSAHDARKSLERFARAAAFW